MTTDNRLDSSNHPLRIDFFCAVVILGMILSNAMGYLWYRSGVTIFSSSYRLDILFLLVQPCSILLLFFFVIYLVIRLYVRLSAAALSELATRIFLVIAIGLAYELKPMIYSSNETLFLRGMAKAVNERIAAEPILDWLSRQEVPPMEPDLLERNSYYYKGVGRILVPYNKQPEYVRQMFNGGDIYVLYNWEKKKFYVLRFGTANRLSISGLKTFEWGLSIGLSPADISQAIADRIAKGNQQVARLSENVHVWCNTQ
jgi:hypothetical protein